MKQTFNRRYPHILLDRISFSPTHPVFTSANPFDRALVFGHIGKVTPSKINPKSRFQGYAKDIIPYTSVCKTRVDYLQSQMNATKYPPHAAYPTNPPNSAQTQLFSKSQAQTPEIHVHQNLAHLHPSHLNPQPQTLFLQATQPQTRMM